MTQKIVFFDLDGGLAHFIGGLKEIIRDPPEMFEKDFFLNLEPTEGSKDFMDWALDQPYLRIYIASKPSILNMWSTIEKYQWVNKHFYRLIWSVNLVCDKELLRGDLLVDDEHETWGHKFKGDFFHFDNKNTKESFEKLKVYIEEKYKLKEES